MMIEMVIYKKGEVCIQTTVRDGLCDLTGDYIYKNGCIVGKAPNLTVEAYLNKLGPEYECISFDEALEKIRKAESDIYLTPFIEISEEAHEKAFQCLPPEKLMTVDGVIIFRMMEYSCGNITAHYGEYQGKFYFGHRRTSHGYSDMAREIITLFNQKGGHANHENKN